MTRMENLALTERELLCDLLLYDSFDRKKRLQNRLNILRQGERYILKQKQLLTYDQPTLTVSLIKDKKSQHLTSSSRCTQKHL